MIQISVEALIGLMGIPAIISGIFMMEIQRSANKREKKRDEQEKSRCEHELITLECINASLSLGLVTAKAVQRIPDANCNGDMHEALDEAEKVVKKHTAFMNKQVTQAMRSR